MSIVLWQSETKELAIDPDIPYSRKIGDTTAIVGDSYDTNSMHTTSVLFVGPSAERVARKWAEFVNKFAYASDEDETGTVEDLDVNCEPLEALDKFVIWLQSQV